MGYIKILIDFVMSRWQAVVFLAVLIWALVANTAAVIISKDRDLIRLKLKNCLDERERAVKAAAAVNTEYKKTEDRVLEKRGERGRRLDDLMKKERARATEMKGLVDLYNTGIEAVGK